MAFKLNTKTIVPAVKTGAKVAVPVGAGLLFGHVGAAVAKQVSPRIAAFAARSPTNEGIVRFLVGVPLGLVLALILAKKNVKTFVKLAALSIAGTTATAVQPLAQRTIDSAQAKLTAMLSRGSSGGAAALPPATTSPQLQLAPRASGFMGNNPLLELSRRGPRQTAL